MAITKVSIGDTVWLKAEFKDRTGTLTDPAGSVTLNVYDEARTLLYTVTATKTDTGTYEAPYVVPDGSSYLIYEYSGTLNGYTAKNRDRLDRQFVKTPVG